MDRTIISADRSQRQGLVVNAVRTQGRSLRVTTFGTSLTARGGWQQAVATDLQGALGINVVVSTWAKSGASSEWGREQVGAVMAQCPDVVMVEFAANDAALDRFISLRRSADNVRFIIGEFRRLKPELFVELMTMNPMIGARGLIRPRLDAYYEQYKPLAMELGAGFIDNRPDWQRLSRAAIKAALPDGSHPTPPIVAPIISANVVKAAALW